MTVQQLATAAGCAKSYISAIETGARANPPGEALVSAIEAALYLPAGSLIRHAHLAAAPKPLRDDFARLIEISRLAREMVGVMSRDVSGRNVSDELRDLLSSYASPSDEPAREVTRVPIVSREEDPELVIARGREAAFSVPIATAETPAFAMPVSDDTMNPNYLAGDVVVFAALPPLPGQDGAVRLKGNPSTLFRRVFPGESSGGEVRLQPLNHSHAPLIVPSESVTGRYRAVAFWREIAPPTRPEPS